MDRPSRKALHNARVRARLLDAATALVQSAGPGAATIDAICEGAGMTRGAFYTHFPSKAAILSATAQRDPPLLTMLKGRSDRAPGAMWLGLRYTLDAMLRLQETGEAAFLSCGLGMAREAGDATTAGEQHQELLAEMSRGAPVPAGHAVLGQILAIAIGAQHTVQALPPAEARTHILRAMRETISQLFDAVESVPEGAKAVSG